MGRAGCCLGTLLIGFAMVSLFALVVIPVLPFGENNPTLMQIKGALLCEPGQQYVMEGQNFSDNRGSGRRFQVYCVTANRTKISVMDKDFLVSALIFVVPLLIGLAFVIIGAAAASRNTVKRALQSGTQMQDGVLNVGGMQIRVQPGGVVQGATPQAFQSSQTSADLAEKLQQIEEARSKGLITKDEYDRMRQHILDESV
jgi:hypothetical protein